ncbi:MAG: DUF1801 domain-containing protein [Propionibacteriaceae bacterium]
MSNRNEQVDRMMAGLEHPLKPGIEALRDAILASNPELTEQVKWNAPSFCYQGVDRVTFRLRPGALFQLIFHRGAKVLPADGFTFDDPTRLMRWLAADRAVVDLSAPDAAERHGPEVVELVNRWVLV